jgi:Sugar transferases involved in lipopolysaccharide synthesis
VESRQITTMSERAKRDVDYIKNMGAFNDMQLFIRTIGAVITKKGAC